MFIAIEGVDAAGKATQTELLARFLMEYERSADACVVYSFPRYNTPIGSVIHRMLKQDLKLTGTSAVNTEQEDAFVLQCLLFSDKLNALREMKTHVQCGRHVVCDRYSASALAYGAADGLDTTWLEQTADLLIKPDIQILLDVDPTTAAKRRPVGRDRYEKDLAKLNVARQTYRKLWSDGASDCITKTKYLVIDAARPESVVHLDIKLNVIDYLRRPV